MLLSSSSTLLTCDERDITVPAVTAWLWLCRGLVESLPDTVEPAMGRLCGGWLNGAAANTHRASGPRAPFPINRPSGLDT